MSPFDDILDGYFPLRISVSDLMRRCHLRHATLDLSFAPVLKVDGLPPTAPVPLNIRSGRAGMIYSARLSVSSGPDKTLLGGTAHWAWLDRTPAEMELDPMIRLAEPALVRVTPQAASVAAQDKIQSFC